RCVRGTDPVRLTLEPLGAGPGVQVTGAAGAPSFGLGRGTKLAVVRTGPDSFLAFEARGRIGNDAEACRDGVLVYRVRSGTRSGGGPIEVIDAHPQTEACGEDSVYPPLADAPVAAGESFTVPGENVRVEVEGRTASGAWTVRITVGGTGSAGTARGAGPRLAPTAPTDKWRGPLLHADGLSMSCAARDSNPGPAD